MTMDSKVAEKLYYDEMTSYLMDHWAKDATSPRTFARGKLLRLTRQQFYELSTDVFDEIVRRQRYTMDAETPFLPKRNDFHPKRNQARQRLAVLSNGKFKDLCSDVYHELGRRYPEFKEIETPLQLVSSLEYRDSYVFLRDFKTPLSPPAYAKTPLQTIHETDNVCVENLADPLSDEDTLGKRSGEDEHSDARNGDAVGESGEELNGDNSVQSTISLSRNTSERTICSHFPKELETQPVAISEFQTSDDNDGDQDVSCQLSDLPLDPIASVSDAEGDSFIPTNYITVEREVANATCEKEIESSDAISDEQRSQDSPPLELGPHLRVDEDRDDEWESRPKSYSSSTIHNALGLLPSNREIADDGEAGVTTGEHRTPEELLGEEEYCKFCDLLELAVRHDEIRVALLDENECLPAVSVTNLGRPTPSRPADILSEDGLNYMSQMLCRVISSPEQGKILTLPSGQLLVVMHILQMLIDGEHGDYRLLTRFLKKVVRKRECLPSYLFLSGVLRVGEKPIIEGGYADVWKGVHRNTQVAIEILRVPDVGVDRRRLHQEFCKESMIWRQFKHPNILPFYGVCEDEFAPQLALVSPWVKNGDMMTYLKCNENADRHKIVVGIALGLQYLHSLQPEVVHGDLRAANIMIDDNDVPRIADSGLAKAVGSYSNPFTTTYFNDKATLRWKAPELLTSNRFEGVTGEVTTESDVYAYACVCLEVYTGEIPFSKLRDGAVILEVAVHDRRPPRPSGLAIQHGLDDRMWVLMQECWSTQPTDRPEMSTVSDWLIHSWDRF